MRHENPYQKSAQAHARRVEKQFEKREKHQIFNNGRKQHSPADAPKRSSSRSPRVFLPSVWGFQTPKLNSIGSFFQTPQAEQAECNTGHQTIKIPYASTDGKPSRKPCR